MVARSRSKPSPVGRLVYQLHEFIERNPLRALSVRRGQRKRLATEVDASARSLIVFLTPGRDTVSGGILSIASICDETRKFKELHHSETLLCVTPGDPPLLRYTKFRNKHVLFNLEDVLLHFQALDRLLIHIPEVSAQRFPELLSDKERQLIKRIPSVTCNVLVQNVESFAPAESVKALRAIGQVTCTTAHERYATAELRRVAGCPIHKISTYVSPELYTRQPYARKSDLVVISNDRHPAKEEVLATLLRAFPSLKIHEVRKMPYEDYKELLARAKWTITFGEGLDGYFVESVFSGGVSFAVYNPNFFTEDFRNLQTVFPDYASLRAGLPSKLKELDEAAAFATYQDEQFEICSRYYARENYVENLRRYYAGDFTLP